jgi:hypothetical protein
MAKLEREFTAASADGFLIAGVVAAQGAGKQRQRDLRESVQLGRPGSALQGFFPDIAARVAALAARNPAPGRLILSLTPYEHLLSRAWRYLAARREMPAFAELAPDLVACPRGWADVVAELHEALPAAEFLILPASSMPVPALPDTALAMMQRLYRQGVCLPRRQMARLIDVHRKLPQAEPIAAFSRLQAVVLRSRYAEDLARIAAMPGLRIASPEPERAAA